MILYAFLLFILICSLAASVNWRRGIFLLILVGVLQDPIRKMVPGAPGVMTLCVLPVWMAALFHFFYSRQANRAWKSLRYDYPALVKRIKLFLLMLLPPVVLTLAYGDGAWKVALVGLFGYVTPLLALLSGYWFTSNPRQLNKLFAFYLVVTSVAMVGTLLQYFGYDVTWDAIGTQAMNTHWIRWWGPYTIELLSGFYRSPDVMGWHAAALVMLAGTLFFSQRNLGRWPYLMVSIWGVICLLLSGRRKMILMPIIWGCVWLYSRSRGGNVLRGVVVAAMVGGMIVLFSFLGNDIDNNQGYLAYANIPGNELSQRVQQHSLDETLESLRQSGVFGKGIGMASQGMQHLGVGFERSWQEGGLPKLLVELGVFGLLAALILGASLVRAGYEVLLGGRRPVVMHPYVAGVAGILLANGCSFILSHQIFSDILILTMTGFFLGVLLSAPRWGDLSNSQGAFSGRESS